MTREFRPKVFVSYSHLDRELKEKFDTNLRVLREQRIIELWTDGEIQPGDHWPDEITDAMNNAQLILFLVSNNFLASSFIRRKEAPMAMAQVNKGQAVIVPIILTKTPGWQKEEWNTLQALPSEVKPVDHPDWRNEENAFANVEEKLRELIEVLPQKLAQRADQWRKVTQGSLVEQEREPQGTHLSPARREPAGGRGRWLTGATSGLLAVAVLVGAVLMLQHRSKPPGVPPELQAWVDAPKVDHALVEVFAAKGNGFIQNGLQALTSGNEVVVARRLAELARQEFDAEPLRYINGLGWDLVIKGAASPLKVDQMLEVTTYFHARKASSAEVAKDEIQVDPKGASGFGECAGPDVPPGFDYLNTTTGTCADLWGNPCFSPNFFVGLRGSLPEGRQRVACEIKMENRLVYRGVFDLDIPPLVFSVPPKQWVGTVQNKGLELELVEGSETLPAANELHWNVRLKGDRGRLKTPLSFICHFQAADCLSPGAAGWIADPYRAAGWEILRSEAIEGLSWSRFYWANGDGATGVWENGSAIQPLVLNLGSRGRFGGGKKEEAIEVSDRGEPVWRGFLALNVPEQR